MTRVLSLSIAAAIITGCASSPVSVSPNSNWTRVSGEEAGCVSYAPRKREAVDLNIVLKPEFEQTLVAQLDEATRSAPKCWYETPAGTIRLFAGDFCAGGTDAFFEQRDASWKLAKSDMVWITCHPSSK
jgi:hypothetical protein